MTVSRAEHLTADGQWFRNFARANGAAPRPALFLDRDGVIIEERHYLGDPKGVALIDGAVETIEAAADVGWAVVIVTNQAGIGRGYYDWHAYARVEARMLDLLGPSARGIDAILACPNHRDAMPPYRGDHPWRKPRPGMLLAAAEALDIDLARSIIVGDRASDIEAGRAAGLARGIHLATGHGTGAERALALALAVPGFTITSCDSIGAVTALGLWT